MNTIVIGAGAAGLSCAIRLKQNNPDDKVTILERLDKAGQKLLATGNGRCNLSNETAENKDIVLNFFSSLGIKTRTDNEGRIYPYSMRADNLHQTLLQTCKKQNINIITGCTVEKIKHGFSIHTNKAIYYSDTVVVACGGKAQPALGSNGSGYALLQNFSHTITSLSPALVQLVSSSKYPKVLAGHRTKCTLSITLDNEMIDSEYGEVLFTNYGLSGIVCMNLSHIVSHNFTLKSPKKCCAVLDLIPDMNESEILQHITKFGSLIGILGNVLSTIIEKQANRDPVIQSKICKKWQLILTGTKGFSFAQITKGGIPLSEFDNFQSKKQTGLYACGEILDKQFPCGGFNLNFAFYSGICAANEINGKKN